MPQTELKLDVIRESDFFIEETDKEVFITGTTFKMPPFDANSWASKNLTINAYHLTLTESISAPGKTVTITTRFLDVDHELSISVSGAHAKSHPVAANSGRSVGAHGGNGRVGNSGKNGGTILIIAENISGNIIKLNAEGGNGASGQSGGNGQTGANGRNAQNRKNQLSDEGSGRRGGNGAKGGNAGKGGIGGNGGNAGEVTVIAAETHLKVLISIEVGAAGMAGKNGTPGAGGIGGRGGKGTECWYDGPVHEGGGHH